MDIKNRTYSSSKDINKNIYLEIYIKEDGRLILTPLTNNTSSFLKEVSDNKEETANLYCG